MQNMPDFFHLQAKRITVGSQTPQPGKSRAPKSSVFFEKAVPAILIGMGVLTVILILFAAGVLLGFIHF